MGQGERAARRRILRGLSYATLLGCALLCSGAIATRFLVQRAEERYPMLGEHVQVDGLRQHVLVRGEGPPVVFVHGAYGGLQDFAATVLDRAAANHRCVLWDRPGHGYSERPGGEVDPGVQGRLLVRLVRRLQLVRPLLVGFSYGGAVCLAAALEAPDELRGLVLINAPSHPWPDPLGLEYRLAEVPGLGRLLSETLVLPVGSLFGSRSVGRTFDPLPVPALFEHSPLALALRPKCYRANTQDRTLLKPFLREQSRRYGELVLPITALVSTADRVVSPELHVPELREQAPHCRRVLIEGAGHPLLYTHPEAVLAAIEGMPD